MKNLTRVQLKQLAADKGLYLPANLLSISADSKTVKGEQLGYLTGIVYMIPSYKLCPASKMAACDVGCLVSAGRGKFNSVIAGRQNKTALYEKCPEVFYEALRRDILTLERKAAKQGLKACVRLNGTSDINHIPFIMSMPDTQFYDYTKMAAHAIAAKEIGLKNYHLTFSYSGASDSYKKHIELAVDNGCNVAVVFRDSNLPAEFLGLPVISGDDSDLRFLDHKVLESQAVIGLYAKGDAKKDNSGFVVDTNRIV